MQIALGCENGFIYILKNFRIYTYVDVERTVTKLFPIDIQPPYSPSGISALLCIGHFNAVLLYFKKQVRYIPHQTLCNVHWFTNCFLQLICEKIIPSWVQSLFVNNRKEITLGLNNSLIQHITVAHENDAATDNTRMQIST